MGVTGGVVLFWNSWKFLDRREAQSLSG